MVNEKNQDNYQLFHIKVVYIIVMADTVISYQSSVNSQQSQAG